MLIPFILTFGVITIAAPGVPGGTILAALGILSSILGFDETALALMIALFLAQDSFGTACNIIGDGAIAVIVDTQVERTGITANPDKEKIKYPKKIRLTFLDLAQFRQHDEIPARLSRGIQALPVSCLLFLEPSATQK